MTKDILNQAYAAMRHDRRRTSLTVLGMAWGIATVVLLLAYGSGFGRAINNIFAAWGTTVVGVMGGRTSLQAGGTKAGTPVRFTLEDIDRIGTAVPLVRHISPEATTQATAMHDTRNAQVPVSGVYPTMARIRKTEIESGRWLGDEDELQRSRVVVLGSEAKTKLFSGQFAIGEKVRINGLSFEVIGVLAPHMQEGDDNVNKIVYIPFSAMGDLRDTYYIEQIWMDYEGDHEKVVQGVRN